jgi:hypothetical protein
MNIAAVINAGQVQIKEKPFMDKFIFMRLCL